jgi:HemY protein
MIHGDDPPLARAAAFERLTLANPNSSETGLAIAEAALTAQLWGEARRHLTRAAGAGAPSRRVCLLMARLEEGEHGNTEEARNWLERAATASSDGCYLCGRCKDESAEWHAVCPHCGGFDTLAWHEPSSGSQELAITAPLTVVSGRPESANPEPYNTDGKGGRVSVRDHLP